MKKGYVIILSSFLIGGCLMSWLTGDIMRESDQASLLDGALQLHNNPLTPPFFHNYAGQFGSYWLLALTQHLFTFDSLSEYVRWGNYFTLGCFWGGLGIYLISYAQRFSERRYLGRHVLLVVSLTTPAVLLSLPLLSSNVLGGAALLALIGMEPLWSGRRKEGVLLGCILLACAVMLRKDTAFLLPLICFMPRSRLDFGDLFKQVYLWAFLLTTIGVCLLGREVTPLSYLPEVLTDWRLVSCYILFGLLGGGIALGWSCEQGWRQASTPLMKCVAVVAVLLPVLMYLPFMYSPRHLFIASLAPFILAKSAWIPEGSFRSKSLILAFGVNVCWLLIAPIIHGDRKVSISWRGATCYPTADGLWPIGGGAHFLKRLRDANKPGYAVDHNQELWAAFSRLNPLENMARYAFVSGSPQKSYLYLWATYHGAKSRYVEVKRFIKEASAEGLQIIRVSTDRDFLKRSTEFKVEHIVSTEAGRLLFMNPPLIKSNLSSQVISYQQELMTLYRGVEFLRTQNPEKQEGHIYIEKEGVTFKSNYPEVLTQPF